MSQTGTGLWQILVHKLINAHPQSIQKRRNGRNGIQGTDAFQCAPYNDANTRIMFLQHYSKKYGTSVKNTENNGWHWPLDKKKIQSTLK